MYDQFPTLGEVSLVKKALLEMEDSILTFPDLYTQVKKEMNKSKLLTILDYFEHQNWIVTSSKGITWIHNGIKLRNMKGSLEYNSKNKTLKEIKKKRDVKWNKIHEEDEFIPLDKL